MKMHSERTMVSMALRALAQSIDSGRMTKDEARMVAEGLPNVMDAIATQVEGTIGQVIREAAGVDGIPARYVITALYTLSGPKGPENAQRS